MEIPTFNRSLRLTYLLPIVALLACTAAHVNASIPALSLPFTQPALSTLTASPKKVFAHYIAAFPRSIDNKPAAFDYYTTQYLSPTGEGGKWMTVGGFLRDRPLPVSPQNPLNWQVSEMKSEVRAAQDAGIDGFAFDIMASTGSPFASVLNMLNAANQVGTGFKIMLMPDMTAEFLNSPNNLVGVIQNLARYPAAFRLPDGRLVIAPYHAESFPASWWLQLETQLRSQGIDIALLPVFQSSGANAPLFSSIDIGYGDWGPRSPMGDAGLYTAASRAHQAPGIWMAPVSPQDMRPKSLIYTEAVNTLNYRTMWDAAIQGGSDYVQIITWNDFSESTQISPSLYEGHAFYDLTAYYTAWFKTGAAPAIDKDMLYYSYRTHSVNAQPNLSMQSHAFKVTGANAPSDAIELLAFLTSPGTLQIQIGGNTYQQAASAGINSFFVPLSQGTPDFKLIRNGQVAIDLMGKWNINNSINYQDLQYRAASSGRPSDP